MSKVLNMERKMRGILNNYDYQPLPSDPNTIRWRNTAQWCRNTMGPRGAVEE
jgi:restriction system protein